MSCNPQSLYQTSMEKKMYNGWLGERLCISDNLFDSLLHVDRDQICWIDQSAGTLLFYCDEVSGIDGAVCYQFALRRAGQWGVNIIVETSPDRFQAKLVQGSQIEANAYLKSWQGHWDAL